VAPPISSSATMRMRDTAAESRRSPRRVDARRRDRRDAGHLGHAEALVHVQAGQRSKRAASSGGSGAAPVRQ
jgi:hypothetical protein